MGPYLGDYTEDGTLYFMWDTADAGGASITRATDGTISVYKDDNDTQSVAGITDTEDFDGLTGVHNCKIVLTDVFYTTGSDYTVVLSAATIDGQTVNAVLATFSIENRFDETTLADGAHGGSSAVVTLNNVVVNRSDAGPAVDIDPASGAAGVGAVSIRNASGHGLDCRGTGTGAFFYGATYGTEFSALGAGDAIRLTGGATGAGLNASGGTGIELAAVAGPGLQASGTTFGIEATASAGPGLSAVASAGNNDGFVATKAGTGVDFNASLAPTGLDAVLKTSTFALAIADAFCDELLAGHTTADTVGLVLNEWQDGGRLDTILDTILADTGTNGVVLASTEDVYHADVFLTQDTTTDEWTVVWIKNGVPVTTSITNAKIQIIKRTDGTDLVAQTSMSEIGSSETYKYDETVNRITDGEAVVAIVTATIDVATRTWYRVMGRDV